MGRKTIAERLYNEIVTLSEEGHRVYKVYLSVTDFQEWEASDDSLHRLFKTLKVQILKNEKLMDPVFIYKE